MSHPNISIIIPVYNVEKYLDRCVQSILNQTITDIEIILVDDESPDNCPELCDEYARKDSRVKVIHKRNGGLGMACNSGIEAAKGSYIAFCDSDDWVDVDMYQTMYDTAIEYHSDAVFTGIQRVDQFGNITPMSQPNKLVNYETDELKEFIYDMIASESNVKSERVRQMSSKTVLYSSNVIREYNVRFKSEREFISEDLLFNMDFIQHCNRVTELPMTFYNYYVNTDSLTNTLRKDRFEKILFLRDYLFKNYSFYNNSQYYERVDRMVLGYTRSIVSILINSETSQATKKDLIKKICDNEIWHNISCHYPIQDLSFANQIVFYLQYYNKPSLLYLLFEAFNLKRMFTRQK